MDIPSLFDGGGREWGWTRQRLLGSPLPFIPSHEGRGYLLGYVLSIMDSLITDQKFENSDFVLVSNFDIRISNF
jgi:hypothetical protein